MHSIPLATTSNDNIMYKTQNRILLLLLYIYIEDESNIEFKLFVYFSKKSA